MKRYLLLLCLLALGCEERVVTKADTAASASAVISASAQPQVSKAPPPPPCMDTLYNLANYKSIQCSSNQTMGVPANGVVVCRCKEQLDPTGEDALE